MWDAIEKVQNDPSTVISCQTIPFDFQIPTFPKPTLPNAVDLDKPDAINPPHYKDGWSNGAEVIDLTEHLDFSSGNAVKYICRAGKKPGESALKDLQKARWYLDRRIALLETHNLG